MEPGVSQTLRRGTRNGITELSQRAPPIFGWAAITLGIGPHSSSCTKWKARRLLSLAEGARMALRLHDIYMRAHMTASSSAVGINSVQRHGTGEKMQLARLVT